MAKAINYNLKIDVDKAIETAGRSTEKGRIDVQKAAIAVLWHAYNHGDYSKANKLIERLGNSINAQSLVAFFVKYGGLTVDEENECFNGWNGKPHIKAMFEDAKATMWWTLKKPNPFKGFNLQQSVVSLVGQYNKATKKQARLEAEGVENIAEVVADKDTILLLDAIANGYTLEQAIHSIYEVEETTTNDIAAEIEGLEAFEQVA